jgi:steroid delta-isomerase-like uncharacterized protein
MPVSISEEDYMPTATEIHKEIAQAWNSRDFDRLRGLLHPDYTYTGGDGKEIGGGPDAGVAVAKMYAAAFPDATLEVRRVYTQGDTAIAEIVARGTHQSEFMGIAATGRAIEITTCNVAELRDGKVRREREYMDMLSMMTQLGVLRMPGHAARAA